MADSRKTDRPTLLVLLGMYAILALNHLVYWTAPFALPLHMVFSTIAIHLAFTVWHEAAHQNVSTRRWVNNLVGVVGMFPYMTPYFMQKWIHLQHHSRLNERDDPNVIYIDGSFWTLPLRYPRALRYAQNVLRRDPRTGAEKISDAGSLMTLGTIHAIALWHGVLWDLILIWLIPLGVAKLLMDWYINYLPHIGLPADRFLGTRIIDVGWLTPVILCHNYHAIHHLWPSFPWHRYRQVFAQRMDYLSEHGVPIENRLFGPRIYPSTPRSSTSVSG